MQKGSLLIPKMGAFCLSKGRAFDSQKAGLLVHFMLFQLLSRGKYGGFFIALDKQKNRRIITLVANYLQEQLVLA